MNAVQLKDSRQADIQTESEREKAEREALQSFYTEQTYSCLHITEQVCCAK